MKRSYKDIAPDEIFMDSKNLPEFDVYQFEGRLEKPISPKIFSFLGLGCFLVAVIFLIKFASLQIVHGSFYKDRSENNKLKQILLVAPRGAIYSRDGKQLAWNQKSDNESDFPLRKYTSVPGFSNLLGFIKYPAKDKIHMFQEILRLKDGIHLFNLKVWRNLPVLQKQLLEIPARFP